MKLEFSPQIFEKTQISNFVKICPVRSRVVPCERTDRQTDMTKVIVALCNIASVPNKTGYVLRAIFINHRFTANLWTLVALKTRHILHPCITSSDVED